MVRAIDIRAHRLHRAIVHQLREFSDLDFQAAKWLRDTRDGYVYGPAASIGTLDELFINSAEDALKLVGLIFTSQKEAKSFWEFYSALLAFVGSRRDQYSRFTSDSLTDPVWLGIVAKARAALPVFEDGADLKE